jgi:FkbM family methyltransferase
MRDIDMGMDAKSDHHVLLLARHASTVHAFEPVKALCASIADKVRENGLQNVRILSLGLGDMDSAVPFFIDIIGIPAEKSERIHAALARA